jgi:hypothetical protein
VCTHVICERKKEEERERVILYAGVLCFCRKESRGKHALASRDKILIANSRESERERERERERE